ncbi:MAG: hypothetical protein M1829_004243 [Trizodia sp. TS-e1964]|nr:MAG: hypothetical protein M1829_004243 [Trizodia sp. TS-e1964]
MKLSCSSSIQPTLLLLRPAPLLPLLLLLLLLQEAAAASPATQNCRGKLAVVQARGAGAVWCLSPMGLPVRERNQFDCGDYTVETSDGVTRVLNYSLTGRDSEAREVFKGGLDERQCLRTLLNDWEQASNLAWVDPPQALWAQPARRLRGVPGVGFLAPAGGQNPFFALVADEESRGQRGKVLKAGGGNLVIVCDADLPPKEQRDGAARTSLWAKLLEGRGVVGG